MKLFMTEKDMTLFSGDCIEVLNTLDENSVDLIFADPPYFLSNNGPTCKSGKLVSVNKADWDKSKGLNKDFSFNLAWLTACRRVLKDDGSIWVSGTMHNIYQVGFALQKLGFKILNEISWYKPNAPPNLVCKYFSHAHETIIWARKNKTITHKFNYDNTKQWSDKLSPSGEQMKSVWTIPLTPPSEKICGKHPTQKPIELLRRIILSTSKEGDLILDPFNGSGTTAYIAKKFRRRYIGIDKDEQFLQITMSRLSRLKE